MHLMVPMSVYSPHAAGFNKLARHFSSLDAKKKAIRHRTRLEFLLMAIMSPTVQEKVVGQDPLLALPNADSVTRRHEKDTTKAAVGAAGGANGAAGAAARNAVPEEDSDTEEPEAPEVADPDNDVDEDMLDEDDFVSRDRNGDRDRSLDDRADEGTPDQEDEDRIVGHKRRRAVVLEDDESQPPQAIRRTEGGREIGNIGKFQKQTRAKNSTNQKVVRKHHLIYYRELLPDGQVATRPRFQLFFEVLVKEYAKDTVPLDVTTMLQWTNILGFGVHVKLEDKNLKAEDAFYNLMQFNVSQGKQRHIRYTANDQAAGLNRGYERQVDLQSLTSLFVDVATSIDSTHMTATATKAHIKTNLLPALSMATYLKAIEELGVDPLQRRPVTKDGFALPALVMKVQTSLVQPSIFTRQFFWSTVQTYLYENCFRPKVNEIGAILTDTWRSEMAQSASGLHAANEADMPPLESEHYFNALRRLNYSAHHDILKMQNNPAILNSPQYAIKLWDYRKLKAAQTMAGFDLEKKLPDSVKATLKWFQKYATHPYRELRARYMDLSMSGNIMVHHYNLFSTTLNVGGLTGLAVDIHRSTFDVFNDSFNVLRNNILTTGGAGVGKSSCREMVLTLMIPGTHELMVHESTRAWLGDDDTIATNKFRYVDETRADWTIAEHRLTAEKQGSRLQTQQELSSQQLSSARPIKDPITGRMATYHVLQQRCNVLCVSGNKNIPPGALLDRFSPRQAKIVDGAHGVSVVHLAAHTPTEEDWFMRNLWADFWMRRQCIIMIYHKFITTAVLPDVDYALVDAYLQIMFQVLKESNKEVRARLASKSRATYRCDIVNYAAHIVFSSELAMSATTDISDPNHPKRTACAFHTDQILEMSLYMIPNEELAIQAILSNLGEVDNSTEKYILEQAMEFSTGLCFYDLVKWMLYSDEMMRVEAILQDVDVNAAEMHKPIRNPGSRFPLMSHPALPPNYRPGEQLLPNDPTRTQDLFYQNGGKNNKRAWNDLIQAIYMDDYKRTREQFWPDQYRAVKHAVRVPRPPRYTFMNRHHTENLATEHQSNPAPYTRHQVRFRQFKKNDEKGMSVVYTDVNYIACPELKSLDRGFAGRMTGLILGEIDIRNRTAQNKYSKFDREEYIRTIDRLKLKEMQLPCFQPRTGPMTEYDFCKLIRMYLIGAKQEDEKKSRGREMQEESTADPDEPVGYVDRPEDEEYAPEMNPDEPVAAEEEEYEDEEEFESRMDLDEDGLTEVVQKTLSGGRRTSSGAPYREEISMTEDVLKLLPERNAGGMRAKMKLCPLFIEDGKQVYVHWGLLLYASLDVKEQFLDRCQHKFTRERTIVLGVPNSRHEFLVDTYDLKKNPDRVLKFRNVSYRNQAQQSLLRGLTESKLTVRRDVRPFVCVNKDVEEWFGRPYALYNGFVPDAYFPAQVDRRMRRVYKDDDATREDNSDYFLSFGEDPDDPNRPRYPDDFFKRNKRLRKTLDRIARQ